MFWFEQQVVTALSKPLDPERRAVVCAFVEDALRSMPEHLRAGIALQSLFLGCWYRLLKACGGHEPTSLKSQLARWESSPLGPLRQYCRMFRSLVNFAEYELVPEKKA